MQAEHLSANHQNDDTTGNKWSESDQTGTYGAGAPNVHRSEGNLTAPAFSADTERHSPHCDPHQPSCESVTQFVDQDAGENEYEIQVQRDLPIFGEQVPDALNMLCDPLGQNNETKDQEQERPKHCESLSSECVT